MAKTQIVFGEVGGGSGTDIGNYQSVYAYFHDATSGSVNLTTPCDAVANVPFQYNDAYTRRTLFSYTDGVFCKKGETKNFTDHYASTGSMTLSADGQTFSFTRGSTDGYTMFVFYKEQ